MRGNLRSIFSRDDLQWVTDRLARRITAGQPLDAPLTLNNASRDQRRAMDDLLGRKASTGNTLTVDVVRLCASIGVADIESLARECCEQAFAEAASRANRTESWKRVFSDARKSLESSDAQIAWLDQLEREGLLKRLSSGEPAVAGSLLQHAAAILRRLPANGLSLADLAASTLGDSHALDASQPLSTLCLRAIRLQHGIDGLTSSSARRRAWQAAGVFLDDLSAPVLVFNLAARPGTSIAAVLELQRKSSLPAWLSLRQVTQAAEAFEPLPNTLETVFVCENPSVVSRAATELGGNCRPLICTNGRPTAAVMTLLRLLRRGGTRILAHADFDWTGLQVVDQLVREFQAEPWQMTREGYDSVPATVALNGTSFHPPWAADLSVRMRERGHAVFEEQVCDALLGVLQLGCT